MNIHLPSCFERQQLYHRPDALKREKPTPAIPFLLISPEVQLLVVPVSPALLMSPVIDENEPEVAK